MVNKDSVAGTLLVAFLVCLVCAIFVASAAVSLKPLQDANIEQDRQKNILAAAGLLDDSVDLETQFAAVTTKVVDLRTGKFTDEVDPITYNHLAAAKSGDPALGQTFSELGAEDLAKISARENFSVVYIIQGANSIDKIILPIRGYGLWSTMQGFIALEGDLNTVAGLGFFAHAETPGLGGEIDNPTWKKIWIGKEVYDQGEVALSVIKGAITPAMTDLEYKVDGLSGATLTSRGVHNLIQFWMGDMGFAPFLKNLKAGDA